MVPTTQSVSIMFPRGSIFSTTSAEGTRERKRITMKHAVYIVSFIEIIGSIVTMILYSYSVFFEPAWHSYLLPCSNVLCKDNDFVNGITYSIVLMGFLELVMAVYLLDGTKRENLGKVRFWLSAMVINIAMGTILIFGMALAGIHCPKLDVAAFVIFIRFLEILVVKTWVERKNIQQKTEAEQEIIRKLGHRNHSVISISSDAPPPSYSECTFPSCTMEHVPPRGLFPIKEGLQS